MDKENENKQNPSAEPENLQGSNNEKESRNREEYKKTPESGWEAGQGISNSQFIKRDDQDLGETERGSSEAGIGMAEIKRKQELGEIEKDPFLAARGTGGSEAGS